jgi:SDR family mycofactocin-dependent oxidoreductase
MAVQERSMREKVAFITGVARGQGRSHAVRLAREGVRIFGMDLCRDLGTTTYAMAAEDDLEETKRLVKEAGSQLVATVGDVRSLADVEACVAAGLDAFGRLDIVLANAGIISGGLTWELTPEQWADVVDICLTGVWHTVRAAIPTMIEQGDGGSIVLTSSVGGLKGLPFSGHYVAAKHGLVGLCRTLANELGEHEIRVNTIHPNGVNTPLMTATDLISRIEAVPYTLGPIYMNSLPRHFVEPEDVSELVYFLVSEAGRHTTGAQLPMDLGNLIR